MGFELALCGIAGFLVLVSFGSETVQRFFQPRPRSTLPPGRKEHAWVRHDAPIPIARNFRSIWTPPTLPDSLTSVHAWAAPDGTVRPTRGRRKLRDANLAPSPAK